MERHDRPRTHPPEELLAAHAAGQPDTAHRVVLEAHLASCPSCMETLRSFLEPGGRWLEVLPGELPAQAVWGRLQSRLETEGTAPAVHATIPLPAAAQVELPDIHGHPRWRWVPLSAARYLPLVQDTAANVELLVLRMPGGKRFPRHIHLGFEDVVILAGGYQDEVGHFEAGDYFRYPPGSEHAPLMDEDEVCWAVGRIEGGFRFKGLLGLLQRLVS